MVSKAKHNLTQQAVKTSKRGDVAKKRASELCRSKKSKCPTDGLNAGNFKQKTTINTKINANRSLKALKGTAKLGQPFITIVDGSNNGREILTETTAFTSETETNSLKPSTRTDLKAADNSSKETPEKTSEYQPGPAGTLEHETSDSTVEEFILLPEGFKTNATEKKQRAEDQKKGAKLELMTETGTAEAAEGPDPRAPKAPTETSERPPLTDLFKPTDPQTQRTIAKTSETVVKVSSRVQDNLNLKSTVKQPDSEMAERPTDRETEQTKTRGKGTFEMII